MSRITVEAWRCDREQCGHVWLSLTKPKACAKCKCLTWDKDSQAEPKERKVISGIQVRRVTKGLINEHVYDKGGFDGA